MGHLRLADTFRPSPTTDTRWHRHVRKGAAWECWPWTGAVSSNEYGEFHIGTAGPEGQRKSVSDRSHRVIYRMVWGEEIPGGFHIDHICRNRVCANPYHLRIVTPAENALNSDITNAVREECPQGHPYDKENTYHYDSRRHCRTCRAEHMRRWKAQNSEGRLMGDRRPISAYGVAGAPMPARSGPPSASTVGSSRGEGVGGPTHHHGPRS